MQEIINNTTIRNFLHHFQFADQNKILQDLIVIGIQTVMTNLTSQSNTNREDSLDEKQYDQQSIVSQIQQVKGDLAKIHGKIEKQQEIFSMSRKPQNTVRIITHYDENNQNNYKVSPRRKEITGKVTSIYPEGREMQPAKSQQKFRHHLDDTEMKQAFYEPILPQKFLKNQKPTKQLKAQKDQLVNKIQNVSNYSNAFSNNNTPIYDQDSPMKTKYQQSKNQLKRNNPPIEISTKTSKNTNKKFTKQMFASKQSKSLKQIKQAGSKIKDLIDKHKRNARNLKFHQPIQVQKVNKQEYKGQNIMSFKKIKQQTYREYEQSESSYEKMDNQQEFSPYKKQNKIQQQYELNNYEDDIPSQLSESKQISNDSEFSIYESNNQVDRRYHNHETQSYSSYSGASSYSSRFPNKAVGKISSRKK